jgi:hypothetical protein
VSEARDDKSTPRDDGKANAFLVPDALQLTASFAGAGQAIEAVASVASIAASDFDARAPPARS